MKKVIMEIYEKIITDKKKNKKSFALLIDPDRQNAKELISIIKKAEKNNVDYFFVGGKPINK